MEPPNTYQGILMSTENKIKDDLLAGAAFCLAFDALWWELRTISTDTYCAGANFDGFYTYPEMSTIGRGEASCFFLLLVREALYGTT